MKKELIIFLGVFLFLTLTMHYKEWGDTTLEHLTNLSNSSAYGIGIVHPIAFSMAVYIVLLIPRLMGSLIKNIYIKKGLK